LLSVPPATISESVALHLLLKMKLRWIPHREQARIMINAIRFQTAMLNPRLFPGGVIVVFQFVQSKERIREVTQCHPAFDSFIFQSPYVAAGAINTCPEPSTLRCSAQTIDAEDFEAIPPQSRARFPRNALF